MLGDAKSRSSARPLVTGESAKPSLLYISPVVPSLTGNGLAMRGGMVLEALSREYRVSLLVVPLYPPFETAIPEYFLGLCERSAYTSADEAVGVFRSHSFDVIHAFRLSVLLYARAYFGERGKQFRCLDLDDIESTTHRRMGALYRTNGDSPRAAEEETAANRHLLLEGVAFRMVDQVYVCSESDRLRLIERCPADVAVVPNAVREPANIAPADSGIFRFLFLGNLSYYPNHDAVVWFCSAILPLIRQRTSIPFEVDIAGRNAPENSEMLVVQAGARFVGGVPDVAPLYAAAHAVIAPLRTGGGSRIKILEAFSYGRPVITTPAGIEGIEAVNGHDVLIRESAEEFADGCIRLMTDRPAGDRLARNARVLWSRAYSSEALQRKVSSLVRPQAHQGSRSDGTPPAAT